jgi:Ner family transcriptional regulator
MDTPSAIGTDWHAADVKAALQKRGISLRALAREHDYSHIQRVLVSPWWAAEQLVAKALGVPAATIWPSRYVVARNRGKSMTRNQAALKLASKAVWRTGSARRTPGVFADLRQEVEALPLFAPSPADPFGDLPPSPPTEGLPPALAAASAALSAALHSPPGPASWPVVNTPALQAMLDREAAKGGRPSAVKPHQVVRLARFVRLGDTLTEAAAKAGLKRSTAQRVLSGQHEMAHHQAVTATGLSFPGRNAAQNPPKTSTRRDQAQAATHVAKRHENAAAADPVSFTQTGGAA